MRGTRRVSSSSFIYLFICSLRDDVLPSLTIIAIPQPPLHDIHTHHDRRLRMLPRPHQLTPDRVPLCEGVVSQRFGPVAEVRQACHGGLTEPLAHALPAEVRGGCGEEATEEVGEVLEDGRDLIYPCVEYKEGCERTNMCIRAL